MTILTPLLQVALDFRQEAVTAELPNAEGNLGGLISSLLSAIMAIAGLLLLFYIIWGAIEWLTAGGDNSEIQKARDKITQAVIGLLVLSSSVAIYSAVRAFVGLERDVVQQSFISRAISGARNSIGGFLNNFR